MFMTPQVINWGAGTLIGGQNVKLGRHCRVKDKPTCKARRDALFAVRAALTVLRGRLSNVVCHQDTRQIPCRKMTKGRPQPRHLTPKSDIISFTVFPVQSILAP